ncbi:MAG: hypothetical protein EBQ54_02770 [Actinobacteria bacterium]|nr:hypothetical protein [Actinomycetota bacterium]
MLKYHGSVRLAVATVVVVVEAATVVVVVEATPDLQFEIARCCEAESFVALRILDVATLPSDFTRQAVVFESRLTASAG